MMAANQTLRNNPGTVEDNIHRVKRETDNQNLYNIIIVIAIS